ncbi:hypothetical protein H4R19_002825 [Coemansia spiralis]|nr:hypothetical protein H4R19_002825 [Coemansia spiralis]
MLSTACIELFPDSREIVLCGGPRGAGGAIATGRVVVAAKQAAQLVRLVVTLRPRRARLFQARQSVAPAEQYQAVLVTGSELQPQVVHCVLESGAHEWRFSIAAPGSLAETVFGRDCFVAYELVASAQGSGAFGATAHSQAHPIAVKRVPLADGLWASVASQPICESATWRGQLELSLSAPSRIAHDQQRLAVRGVIRPLEKGFVLRRAGFQIVERISHCTGVHGTLQPCSAKRVVVDDIVDISATCGVPCEFNVALPEHPSPELELELVQETSAERCLAVPPAYTGIQYDIHHGPVRTRHELVLLVTVADARGSTHRLRLATPVFVLPRTDAHHVSLPRYEEAAADRLVTSAAGAQQRDSDFWSQFVLVDTVDTASDAVAAADAPCDTLTACPLALEGYRAADDAQLPPPSYPGAACAAIERTVVTAVDADTDAETDALEPDPVASRRFLRSSPFRRRRPAPAHCATALAHA